MALFSVEIADADVPKVLEALASSYNYQETIPNPDDPNGDPIPIPNQKLFSPTVLFVSFYRNTFELMKFEKPKRQLWPLLMLT